MGKVFQVYDPKLLWNTIWLIPGRVIEGEIKAGDVLMSDFSDEDTISPKLIVVAIETYGRAVSFLSEGSSGQLIIQVSRQDDDGLLNHLTMLKASI